MNAYKRKVKEELANLGYDFRKMSTIVNERGIWATEIVPMDFISNRNDFLKISFHMPLVAKLSNCVIEYMQVSIGRRTPHETDPIKYLITESYTRKDGQLLSRREILNITKDYLAILRLKERFEINIKPLQGNIQAQSNKFYKGL